MDPQLSQLKLRFRAISGLTEQHLSAHPPGKCRAGEILEHLYLTYTGTTKGFQRVLEEQTESDTTTLEAGRRCADWLGFAYLP